MSTPVRKTLGSGLLAKLFHSANENEGSCDRRIFAHVVLSNPLAFVSRKTSVQVCFCFTDEEKPNGSSVNFATWTCALLRCAVQERSSGEQNIHQETQLTQTSSNLRTIRQDLQGN